MYVTTSGICWPFGACLNSPDGLEWSKFRVWWRHTNIRFMKTLPPRGFKDHSRGRAWNSVDQLNSSLVAPLGESLLNFKSLSSWIICFDCLLVSFYTHPNFFNVEAFPGAVRQQIFPRFASISVHPKPQTAEPARRTGRYSVWPCSRDVATITSYLIIIKKKKRISVPLVSLILPNTSSKWFVLGFFVSHFALPA